MLKHVIITGGTGTLGTALQKAFLASEWQVTALGKKDLELKNPEAIRAFFNQHSCDLLICAAGIIRDAPLIRMEPDAWDDVFELSYTAAKNCALAALPTMLEKGSGHVIFISSHASLHPAIGQAAYAAAKAALHGLTKDLAEKYGARNLRFNVILPGFLLTKMTDPIPPHKKEQIQASHHLKRYNTPETTADFIKFLAEKMPHTSGQIFQLDSRS